MRWLLITCAAVTVAGLAGASDAAIDYNASKSNTVMATDASHGYLAGKRRHHALDHKPENAAVRREPRRIHRPADALSGPSAHRDADQRPTP